MKHFTLLTGKRHILLVLIMLLCSVRVACADDSGLVTQQITVNVPTAGTLSNIIQSDKMFKITNLKITGFLNSDDIRFIRKMAGCYYNGNGSKYDGHLQYLDLGSISQISYVHSFEFYDENGYRSTLNDCLFPLAYLYNLKTVVLPNLYKDYNFSLMGCRNLTTAKMPDNLEKIGNNAFKDCDSLKNIQIPSAITSIGEYAFSGCSCLTDIQIPDNVTYIGQYAFYGCNSLKGINVPTDFVNISASTFENCANLQYFFNYNYIESIGDRAFAGCSKLSWIANLFLGSPSIGTYVFENCKSLKNVRVPENIKTLPRGMFKGCSSLSSIALPQYLLSIDDYAFDGCSSLADIKLPIYLNSLGYRALADCSKLTSLDLPSSLQNIGSYAFAGCNAMERIDANMAAPITASQSTFNGVDFTGCSNLRYISLPSNIKYIGECTFSNSGIREITLPQQVTEITNNMFEGCQNLKHIYLQDGLKSIGDYAFQYCNSLGGITLPNSVTKIGKGCFSHCDYLKAGVTLSDAITEIPEEAFAYCGCLYEIKLPAELKRIGYRAFCGSPYIGSFGGIKIPSKVTEIAPEAFYKSFQEIEVLELPANLKTVGDYAFAGCSARVIHAYMSEPVALTDSDLEMLPRSDCKLYVPKGCANKYRQAEIWKEFDIEEMEVTGIASVTNDSTITEVSRYDVNGQQLSVPTKGLNIVHYSDGTVKKIMVE